MTDHPSPPEPSEYGLVMPFVTCSPDGPHDSESYVEAWRVARLDATLEALVGLRTHGLTSSEVQLYASPASVPQIDLVALKHSFTMTSEPWDEYPDEWTLVTLTFGQETADA